MSDPCPRFVPERALPPYSYVPGQNPHPVADPRGHSHGVRHAAGAPVTPETWAGNRDYLYGFDLFNRGYYWEAHEAWEGLWHLAGRAGLAGDFLKGLIQLAAAGVKDRAGVPAGVQSLAARAAELWAGARRAAGDHYLGLNLGDLIALAEGIAASAAWPAGVVLIPADQSEPRP